jgi:hypothetical protein
MVLACFSTFRRPSLALFKCRTAGRMPQKGLEVFAKSCLRDVHHDVLVFVTKAFEARQLVGRIPAPFKLTANERQFLIGVRNGYTILVNQSPHLILFIVNHCSFHTPIIGSLK